MIRFGAELEDIQYEGQPSSVYFGLPMYEKVDVQAMIDEAVAKGEREITIPRGAYRLQPQSGKGAHILLDHLSDFTVHAYDVVFLYQDFRVCGMRISHCYNVTVEGLSSDYEPNPHAQMKITYIDPNGEYVDGHIDEGFMTEWNDMYGYKFYYPNYFYDGVTFREIKKKRPFGVDPKNIEPLGDRNVRIHYKMAADLSKRLRPGDYLAWSPRYIMNGNLSMVCNSGCHIKDYTVWSGLVGVSEHGSLGKNYYDHFCVVPGPRLYKSSEDRINSTTADAAHMSDNYVGATIENGVYHSMGDDGVNFYAYFTRIAEVISDTEFVLAERSSFGPNPYENLRFYDGTTLDLVGNGAIKCSEKIEGEYTPAIDLTKDMGAVRFRASSYYRVTMQRPVKLNAGDFVNNTSRCNSNFVLRNNCYFNLRSRGALIKASNGIIENCHFEDCKAAIQIRPEIDWTESGYSQNVVVRNNRIVQCGESAPALAVEGKGALDQRDILIENNIFIDVPYSNMLLNSCRGVTVRGNRFGAGNLKHSSGMPAVIVGAADGVHFENNRFHPATTPVGVTDLSLNVTGVSVIPYSTASDAVPKGEQGYDGWHFCYAPVGTNDYVDYVYQQALHAPDGWHAAEGSDEDFGCVLCWWWNFYMCPGEKADVSKTYVCPRDGEVAISANHECTTGEQTEDGIRAMVLHNEELLWEDTLGYQEFVMQPTVIRKVKAGDRIHFRINKIGNAKNDGVDWDPTVLYVK